MEITGRNPSSRKVSSSYLGILFPTTRIEASNSQLPLEPLANSDIPLVVIIDLLLLKNMVEKHSIHKTSSNGPKLPVQWNLDLRKPDLRKNLDLRKIVGTTDFLVHKLFDLRKIF